MPMLMVMEGNNAAARTAAAMYSAIKCVSSLPNREQGEEAAPPPQIQVLFCRTKASLGRADHADMLSSFSSLPSRVLQSIGVKYVDEGEILPLLLHVHLLPELRVLVLDDVDALVGGSNVQRRAAIALAATLHHIDTVIITTHASSTDTTHHATLPVFASRIVFKV